MSGDSKVGYAVGICFMTLWCTIAFGMGISALQMGTPFLLVLVPFGMGVFGIVICIAGVVSQRRRQQKQSEIRRYSGESIVYTGDYQLHPEPKPQNQKKVYMVPSHCPSCGESINTEEIDWVGPLQAKCPNCGGAIDAEERTF